MPDASTETTIWIDNARSLTPKYQLSVPRKYWDWRVGAGRALITVGFEGAPLAYAAEGRAM